MNDKRGQWSSSLGFILAAAGSAIGLGNIWKFPGVAYENGGGTFLVIYLVVVFTIGLSAALAEFIVGRTTQKNVFSAYAELNKKWRWLGILNLIVPFIILTYYIQVSGWILKYIFAYASNSAAVFADPTNYFLNFLGGGGFSIEAVIIMPIIVAIIAGLILSKGVTGGIEKLSKFLMPALFIILGIIAIRSLTLPEVKVGVQTLLSFNMDDVNAKSIMAAIGQTFFSVSVGMGILCTYASYMSKEENLCSQTIKMVSLDTLVAFIAAFAILPITFATTGDVGSGGSFAFISLATVFQSMPAGSIFGLLFYILLGFAAITSLIALMQVIIAYMTEEWHMSLNKAIVVLLAALLTLGALYTMTQTNAFIKLPWLDANGLQWFSYADGIEKYIDNLLLPISGLSIVIFVGWVWKAKNAALEIRQGGKHNFPGEKIWIFMVKFAIPAAIIFMFLGFMGILKF